MTVPAAPIHAGTEPGTPTAESASRRSRRRTRLVRTSLGVAVALAAATHAGLAGAATKSPTAPAVRTGLPKAKTADVSQRSASPKQQSFPIIVGSPTTVAAAPAPTNPPAGDQSLRDNFTKPADWLLFADKESVVAVSTFEDNPMLLMAMETPHTLFSFPMSRRAVDAEVTFTARMISTNDDYGINVTCRAQRSGRYQFMASSFGSVAIFRVQNDTYTNLLPEGRWVASPEVAKGFTSITMTASCRGDLLTLSVNNRQVASVRDTAITHSGNAGVSASNFSKDKTLRVSIDDVVIRM